MADPWIRVHANLRQKSVTFRAMDVLGVKRAAAIGHLVMFWSAVSQCGRSGLVSDCSDAQIEEWGGWEGTRGRFAKFIRDTHLDDDGRVREWDDYAGVLETLRERDRQRKRDVRAQAHAEVQRTSDGNPVDVPRMSAPTKRNDTKRDENTAKPLAERVKRPRVAAPKENWVSSLGDWWGDEIAPVEHGFIGRLARPAVKKHGIDEVKRRALIYKRTKVGYRSPKDFFDNFALYEHESGPQFPFRHEKPQELTVSERAKRMGVI